MLRTPPHILVTTPESLYLLLTAERSREMLRTVRTVIVDEIHAVIGTRRGAHLALSLERLQQVADAPLLRIGLSATQKPIDEVARFLVGTRSTPRSRLRDRRRRPSPRRWTSRIEIPRSPLEAVMSHEVWEEYYDRLTRARSRAHRTTLVFVNTRRMAERVARHLSERLGEDAVTAHHGSLSKEKRLDAETRLKSGHAEGARRDRVARARHRHRPRRSRLPDRIAAPHRHAAAARRPLGPHDQRHAEGPAVPDVARRPRRVRGAAARGPPRRARRIVSHDAPLDVLAQQIVAETACARVRRGRALRARAPRVAVPRSLARADFDAVVDDARRRLRDAARPARGARASRRGATPVCAAGAARACSRSPPAARFPRSPTTASSLEPEDTFIGTLNEDFAIESKAGDIFQLGNASWQIAAGRRRAPCASPTRKGAPPTIPFWLGEAPARSDELSRAVSDLRADVDVAAADSPADRAGRGDRVADRRDRAVAAAAPNRSSPISPTAARALGVMPTQETLVLERFFDESGGMQLVLHAPFGSRINKAWGARAAQALLPPVQLRAAGGGDRGRAAALARPAAFVPARRRVPLPASGDDARRAGAGVARRAGVPDALALEHDDLARRAAQPRRPEGAAAAAADAGRRSDGRGVSRRRRVPREHPRRSRRFPIIRSSTRPCATASRRRWTSTASSRCSTRIHARRAALRRARHAGAVAVRARDPQRAAVRVPGRCAARGAADAGGADADARASRARQRPRRARRRRDRARARRGAARSARRRRAARRAADGGLSAAMRSRRRRRCWRRRARVADASTGDARASRSGSRIRPIVLVAAERLPELLAVHPDATLDPPIAAPAVARGARRGRATTRSSSCCADGWRSSGRRPRRRSAASLAIAEADADAALLALESEGVGAARTIVHRRSAADRDRSSGATAGCSRASIATR